MNDDRGFGHMVMILSILKQKNHTVQCLLSASIFISQKPYPKGGYYGGMYTVRHWFRDARRHEPAIMILIFGRGGSSI
jgi:hypothetical protein